MLTAALLIMLTRGEPVPIRFTAIPAGHTVHVRLESSHCVGHSLDIFEISNGRALAWSFDRREHKEARHVGETALTDKDLARLDELMSFYRQRKRSGCTTLDEVTVTLRKRKKTVLEESFSDRTCAADGHGRLTFLDLLGRIRRENEGGRQRPSL